MEEKDAIPLQPIIEADPVLFTMDAIGWKILLSLILAALFFFILKLLKHYRANKYRRLAITNISNLSAEISDSEFLTQVMYFMKQTALQSYHRQNIASLHGEKWLSFLDEKVKNLHFISEKEVINSAVYKNEIKPVQNFNRNEFRARSIKWIRNHA